MFFNLGLTSSCLCTKQGVEKKLISVPLTAVAFSNIKGAVPIILAISVKKAKVMELLMWPLERTD